MCLLARCVWSSSSKSTTGGRVGQWVYGTPSSRRGLRAFAHHLLEAQRAKELVALLEDLHYVEAMAEAGCVDDVADMQSEVIRKLTRSAEGKASRLGGAASYADSRSTGAMSRGLSVSSDAKGRKGRAGAGAIAEGTSEDPEVAFKLDDIVELRSPAAKSVMTTADQVLFFASSRLGCLVLAEDEGASISAAASVIVLFILLAWRHIDVM